MAAQLPVPATPQLNLNALNPEANLATNHPGLMATWTAASDATITQTVINGTTISNPTVVTQSSQSPWAKDGDAVSTDAIDITAIHPPPQGFVLAGQVKLFGGKEDVTIYSYHAPVPPYIQLDPNLSPIFQMAMLDSMRLSDFIPSIVGTPFDVLNFTNITITLQNYPFDVDKYVGWSLEADLLISKDTGMLYDFFSTTLGMATPKITFRMVICTSEGADWSSSLTCTRFTLEGILPGVTFKPCSGLQFTSIGVRLIASSVAPRRGSSKAKRTSEYGFQVFGDMLINVPGSVTPLELDWVISEAGSALQLVANVKGDIWKDAFGISGLELSAVGFSTSIGIQAPLSSFSFTVDAALVAGSTTFLFFGSISPGTFVLSATVENLGYVGISELFAHLTGDTLDPPNLYLSLGSATATLSNAGFSITIHDLQFENYASVDALVSFSPTGVIVQGEVTDLVTFNEITVEKAYVQVNFGGSSGSSETSVIIGGTVKIESLVVQVGVHLYDDGADDLDYTLFGSIESLKLSTLAPELQGGIFDGMGLQSAALIVASKPDADLSMFIGAPFIIQQGIQICASLGPIASMDKLMGSPQSGLQLNAGWSTSLGFRFDLYLPGAHGVYLGNGLATEPFKLEIQTKPPTLQLTAGLKVAVPKQDPLEFFLSLAIDELGARGVAQMVGYWVDPLGISDQVKIGPNLALSIEIIFAEGLPGGLGFAGGLQIGRASAQIAVNISEDPMHELVYAEVKTLDLADVVDFASQITKVPMAMGPKIIDFEDVKLYICPTGTNIGAVIYPQGVSFAATCIIFGKKGDISVAFGGGGIKMSAGLDNFVLGPLSIRGTSGPRALLDIEMTPTQQHIYADVVARLFDLDITLHMNIDGIPKLTFDLDFLLHFTPLLTFQVDAHMLGDFKDLSSLDFSLTALFEQHLVAYVTQEVQAQLDGARNAANKGFKTAEEALISAQKDADKQIDNATADVTNAYNKWQLRAAAVHASSQKAIDDYTAKLNQFQAGVAAAKLAMDKAIQKASDDLTRANSDRASKMADVQKTLADAQNTWTQKIKDAQAKLDRANANMSRDFGNAESKIDSAQSNVNKIQNDINDMNHKISDYKHAHWYEVHKKLAIPGLEIALGVLVASMKVAKGVLDAAKGILTGTAYLGSKAAIAAANGILSTTQTAGAGAIASAKTSLSAIDSATAAAITHATAVVRDVGQGAEAIAFKAANNALAAFNTANKDVLKFAQAAIDGLVQSVEYIAYQSALNALAAAKHATTSLDGLKTALQGVSAAEDASLKAAEYVVTQGTQAMDIRTIALTATLTGISGGSGTFSAQVAGLLVGQSFNIHTELDIRRSADFITSIFNQLWQKLKDLPSDILHTSNPSRPEVLQAMPIYLQGPASANRPTIIAIKDLSGTDANTFTLANNFHRDAAHSVVVVYGGKLITIPDVIAKVTAAIASHQDYVVQSSNFGGDPAPGIFKSCAVVYEANGFVRGRFTWEGIRLQFSLDINTITYGFGTNLAAISQPIFNAVSSAFFSATSLQVTNDLFGVDPAPNHAKSCTIDYTSYGTRKRRTVNEKAWFNFGKDIAYIEYGGRKITDPAIYEKVFAAMDTTGPFLVNNATMGGDPTPNQPKSCVVHIQQSGTARVVSAGEGTSITIW